MYYILIGFISIIYQYRVNGDVVYNEPTYILGPRYELWQWYNGWVGKGYGDNPLDFIDVCTFHRVPQTYLRVCKLNLFHGENAMIKCPSSKTVRGRIHPTKPGYHYSDLSYIDGRTRNDEHYIEKLPIEIITQRLDTIENGESLLVKYVKHNDNLSGINFICENYQDDIKSDFENLSMVISITFDEYKIDSPKHVSEYIITNNIALRNNYLQWKDRNVDIEVENLPFYNFNIHCRGLLSYRLHDIPGRLFDKHILIDRSSNNLSVFPFTRKYNEFNSVNIDGFKKTEKSGVYSNGKSISTRGNEMELYLSTNLYSIVVPYEFSCQPYDEIESGYKHTLKLKFPIYSNMPKCTNYPDSTESVPKISMKGVLHCPIDIDKYPIVVVSGEDDLYLYNKEITKSDEASEIPRSNDDNLITILSRNSRLVKIKSYYTGNSLIYNSNTSIEMWNYPKGLDNLSSLNKTNLIILNPIKKCEFNSLDGWCINVLNPSETLEINCNKLYPEDLTKVYIKENGEFKEALMSEISSGLIRFSTKTRPLLFYSKFGSFVGNSNQIFLSCDSSKIEDTEKLVEIFLGFNSDDEVNPKNKTRYISALGSNITKIKCPINESVDDIKYKLLPESISEAFYTLPNVNFLDKINKGQIGNVIGMTDYKINKNDDQSNELIISRPKNHITIMGSIPQIFYLCKPQDTQSSSQNTSQNTSNKGVNTIIELNFRSNIDNIRICGDGFIGSTSELHGRRIITCKFTLYPDQKSFDLPQYFNEKKLDLITNEFYGDAISQPKEDESHLYLKESDISYDYKSKIDEDLRISLHKIGNLEMYFDYPEFEMETRDESSPPENEVQDLDLDSFINKYNEMYNMKNHNNSTIGLICPIEDDEVNNPICVGVLKTGNIFAKSEVIENFFYKKSDGYSQSLWVIDYNRWEKVTAFIQNIDYAYCTCIGKDGNIVTTLEIRGNNGSRIAGVSLLLILFLSFI